MNTTNKQTNKGLKRNPENCSILTRRQICQYLVSGFIYLYLPAMKADPPPHPPKHISSLIFSLLSHPDLVRGPLLNNLFHVLFVKLILVYFLGNVLLFLVRLSPRGLYGNQLTIVDFSILICVQDFNNSLHFKL